MDLNQNRICVLGFSNFLFLVVHVLIFLIFTFITITQKLLVLQYWDTSYSKAGNLAVLMSGRTYLWLFYVPRYQRSKMQIRNLVNYLLNITHFYDHKKFRELFYQNNFSSCYYWHRWAPLLIFLNWKTKKVGFGIFYPSKKTKQKTFNHKNLKIGKSEHDTLILCWFRSKKICGSKRSYYWKYGLRGGSKLKA